MKTANPFVWALALLLCFVSTLLLFVRAGTPDVPIDKRRLGIEEVFPSVSDTASSVVVESERSPIVSSRPKSFSVVGRVTDAITGLPVPYASVEATLSDGEVLQTWASLIGEYHIPFSGVFCNLRSFAPGYQAIESAIETHGLLRSVVNVRLVPVNETEVVVAWGDGSPVSNASLSIASNPPTSVTSEGLHKAMAISVGAANTDGMARIQLSEPIHLVAVDEPSGRFGTVFAEPGVPCEIVLELSGARFSFRPPVGVSLSSLRFSLRHLDDECESTDVRFDGFDSPLVLKEGRWILRLEAGPFAIGYIHRDGQVMNHAEGRTVAFSVLESTEEIDVELTSGISIRLARNDCLEAITGPFTYRRRLLGMDGRWRDHRLFRSVADVDGLAELFPVFEENDAGLLSLRIDVPGYGSSVLSDLALRTAMKQSTRIDVLLESDSTVQFRLRYPDETPFSGLAMVEAVGTNSDRELFVGQVASNGVIPPAILGRHESIRVLDWDRQLLVSLGPSDISREFENQVTLDQACGRIAIEQVPNDAPLLAAVGVWGDEYSFIRVGGRLVSPPLFPGRYFVGPPQLAQERRQLSSAFAKNKTLRQGRVVDITVEPAVECRLDWQDVWLERGRTSGSITVIGSKGRLIVVPLYTREGFQAGFWPSMPRVQFDETGNYSIPGGMTYPDLLAVCSLDALGYPVPLDVFPPGEDVVILACSLRLQWVSDLPSNETAIVAFSIPTSGFRTPIEIPQYELAAVWDLRYPLELSALPFGTTKVSVRVGGSEFFREIALQSSGGDSNLLWFP